MTTADTANFHINIYEGFEGHWWMSLIGGLSNVSTVFSPFYIKSEKKERKKKETIQYQT